MIPLSRVRYYLSDKGLQEKVSTLTIAPNELQIARNVHFYENGAWTERNGYIKRFTNPLPGTPAPYITGLYNYVKRDGTSYFLTTANKLYQGVQGDTDAAEVAGGLTFTVGSEGQNFMSFVTFANKAIGTNGVEAMWQFDGTTASTLTGSPPVAEIIETFQNFIFVAGNTTYPYRLYFCNDGDETVWTGTDYIDIGDLTSPITGLAVLFGKLFIFTRRAMYELRGYDRDTFILDEVTKSTGCVAYKSVVKVDNNLVFWSDRGIYSFDGISVHYLSIKAENTIAGLNYNRMPYVVGEIYKAKSQVWFSVSTGSNSAHNEVICMTYDPTEAENAGIGKDSVAFAVYTGMAFNAFGLERSTSQLDRLYAGDYAGLIFKQDTGTNDNTAAIDFSVKTPPIDMGAPEEFKRFRYLFLFVKQTGNYTLNVSYKTDFGPGDTTTTVTMQQTTDASLWGSMIWGSSTWGGSTIIKSRVGLKANGQHLEILFHKKVADTPITIKGFTCCAQLKGFGRYSRA